MGYTTDYLVADDDCDWHYYVRACGTFEESCGAIGDAADFVHELTWMRPVAASSLDESERSDDLETLTRDERGRFQAVTCWIECAKDAAGAEEWYGARYA